MFNVFGAVGDAFRLAYRNMFRVAVVYLAFGIAAGVAIAIFGAVGSSMLSATGSGLGALVALLGNLVANILIFCATLAAVAVVASDALDARVSLREAIDLGLRKSPVGFVAALVVGLAIGLAAAVPYFFLMATILGGGSLVTASVVFVVFLPLVLWISALFAPLFPIMLAEDAGIDAIRRSVAMTKGYRWAIAGGSLLLGLACGVIGAVAGGGAAAIIGGSMALGSGTDMAPFLLSGLIYMLLGMFMAAVGVSYQSAVYVQLAEK